MPRRVITQPLIEQIKPQMLNRSTHMRGGHSCSQLVERCKLFLQ